MVLAPDVNSGSYFNSQDVTGRRAEFVSNYTFAPFGPAHVLKVGAGGGWEGMTGVMTGREVDIERADTTLSQRYTYVGSGRLSRDRVSVGGFLQDAWTITSRVTAQFGFRWEYDTLLSDAHPQPRASLTAKLTEDGRTIVRGGVGVFYSLAPLNVGAFDGLQHRTVTLFADDGVTPLGATELVRNVDGRTRTPRSLNWNTEIDREVVRNLTVRVGYQQRSTRSEPFVDTTPLGSVDPVLQLRGDGRSRYRETQVLARYQFHGSDQLVGSYTHSSAIGDLNEFNAFLSADP
jgi:hypothetical protein